MPNQDAELLDVVNEIRDLIRLMAEPAIAQRDEKRRIAIRQIVGKSAVKAKAIQLMDECLKLNFTYMEAYREKALAFYDLHKYDEALQVLNKAVTLQNSYEEGYYYIGQCLEKLHRYPDAAEAYRKALMYDPGDVVAKEALEKIDKSK